MTVLEFPFKPVLESPLAVPPEWEAVCRLDDLIPGRGVAALLGGEQVAIFLLGYDRHGPLLRAVGNIDPFGRAAVMSRGLIGSRGSVPTVASPLLKQVFSLDTGVCLDDRSQALPMYMVRTRDGVVQLARHRQADAA
ncbi:MAG TPA: nitrite reductase small subunit NirD [Mycobacterium sp.]|nr:nitrite reductase small subunit NirD [Mycobacterium sp.]